MELFEYTGKVESMLEKRARDARQPLGGTIELLPLCNMNCKMCYIRMSRQQMEKHGRMLTCDEWLHIAEGMREAGVLFLMLTGGEPLMYPEFERLYKGLTKMGFIMTMNTNGTLIDEHWANLFDENPIRRLNITLYGTDDETYSRLCHHPKGFTQVMNAVRLLDERGLRYGFNATITPDNVHQLPELQRIADEHHVQLDSSAYLFPPMRKEGEASDSFRRLTPEEFADLRLALAERKNPGMSRRVIAVNFLRKMGHFDSDELARLEGPNCSAGRSGFWANWKGELLACGMLTEPHISLLEHPFKDCWAYITEATKAVPRCKTCDNCEMKPLCPSCSAACLTETGRVDGLPEYLCQHAKRLLSRCREILVETKGEYDL